MFLSAFVFSAVIVLHASGNTAPIVLLAGAAVLTSLYLSYAMVFRIRALCPTCVSLCALNILILLEAVL